MFKTIVSHEYNELIDALCNAAIEAKACGGDFGTQKKYADADDALIKHINEWGKGQVKAENTVAEDPSLPRGVVEMQGETIVRTNTLPELDPKDLCVTTFRPSGGGGWINKPDSGVRITHKPTGLLINESGNRSQHMNLAVAMQKLRALVASHVTPTRRRSDEAVVALATAQNLATAIWASHYKEESPNFEVLTDMMGVLSQIDNMVTGLTRKV